MASPTLLKNPLLETFSQSADLLARNILGTDEAELLTGNRRNNLINAKDGDDTIFGRKGDDRIDSGGGNNVAYGGSGDDYIWAQPEEKNAENFLFGGSGNDKIWGGYSNDGFNHLAGGKGRDVIAIWGDDCEIYGGAGKDNLSVWGGLSTIDGGRGNDVIKTAGGTATITGGAGSDTIKLKKTADNVTITDFTVGEDHLKFGRYAKVADSDLTIEADGNDTVVTLLNGGQIRLLGISPDSFTLASIEGLHIFGTVGDDVLEGGTAGEWFFGYGGDDHISGGAGNDIISVETGTNTLFGGEGNDSISSIYASGLNHVFGGAGDDRITFHSKEAILEGGTGDDEIGCWGERSTVVYNGSLDEGSDVIFSYSAHEDILQVSDTTFDDLLIEKVRYDTIIRLTSGTEITLRNIDPDQVTQDIFDFV